MDTYMEANMNMNLREVSKLRDTFLRALDACERIWGEFAFKRPEGAGWRDQMLAGMYDAQMVAVSLVDDKRISSLAARSAEVIQETRDLFTDKAFNEAVRLSTNTPSRVAYRIGKVLQLVQSF